MRAPDASTICGAHHTRRDAGIAKRQTASVYLKTLLTAEDDKVPEYRV
jgi:hypothetical protein